MLTITQHLLSPGGGDYWNIEEIKSGPIYFIGFFHEQPDAQWRIIQRLHCFARGEVPAISDETEASRQTLQN
jgi:hypothetical protein